MADLTVSLPSRAPETEALAEQLESLDAISVEIAAFGICKRDVGNGDEGGVTVQVSVPLHE